MAVVRLRLFGPAREAAGTGDDSFDALTLADALRQASARYGEAFRAVLADSRVWVSGEEQDLDHLLAAGDEVAVLPPVSGG